MDFDAFDLSRSRTKTLETEIVWDDTIFPVSADLKSELDLSIYKAAYTYSFYNREAGYLGVIGGLYVADLGLALKLQNQNVEKSGDVTAPLPVLGFRGEHYLSPRWRLHGSAEWFLIDAGGYHGKLQDILLGLDLRVAEHAAIGLGYNRMDMDLDATDKSLKAKLDWTYSGALLYLRLDF